jgi:hypothetical protein
MYPVATVMRLLSESRNIPGAVYVRYTIDQAGRAHRQ